MILHALPAPRRPRIAGGRLPRRRLSAGLLPDADELRALAREGLALPTAPALAQPHAGEPRHQVELRRPHVAERDRELPEPPVNLAVVMRGQTLVRDVV